MLTPAADARRENLALIEFDPDCRMTAGARYTPVSLHISPLTNVMPSQMSICS